MNDNIEIFESNEELLDSLELELGSDWFKSSNIENGVGAVIVAIPIWMADSKGFDSSVVRVAEPEAGEDYIEAETEEAILLNVTFSEWNETSHLKTKEMKNKSIWLPKSQIKFLGHVPFNN